MARLSSQKLEAIRSEYKHRRIGGKYPRQKMLPEYTNLYPWVVADEQDPYYIFCTICECRLSAKRSDLGKHEGSMKHKENAAKQKAEKEESNETGNDDVYIKQEPIVEMVESSNMLNFDSESESDDSVDGDVTDDQNTNPKLGPSCKYSKKRRTSEDSQSQNSSTVDCSPLQAPTNPRLSGCEVTAKRCIAGSVTSNTAPFSYTTPHLNTNTSPLSFAAKQNPLQVNKACKITIKKIAAPPPPTALTSTTTISPVPATSLRITSQPQPHQPQKPQSELCGKPYSTCTIPMHSSNQLGATVTPCPSSTSSTARNSFDLFFESVCASVKALPPKLATEGKIRVMQLIGELELRAIEQREQEKSTLQNATSTTK